MLMYLSARPEINELKSTFLPILSVAAMRVFEDHICSSPGHRAILVDLDNYFIQLLTILFH